MDKEKTFKALKKLTWEELDWLEQQCRAYKDSSEGIRVYHSGGDVTHQREAAAALNGYFLDVYDKHHGF